MKKEYRIAKGWKIFVWICVPVFMALFGWIGIMPFTAEKFNPTCAFILAPIAIGLELLLILGLIDTIKGRLIIENDRMASIGVFKTDVLAFQQIKGYKSDQHYLYFIPLNENLKTIKVSTYVGQFPALLQWADQHFNNLTTLETLNDEKEILNSEEYGRTSEERENKLKEARRTTKILNALSWIVALSTWFYPRFYQAQLLMCAILPIIGVIIYKTSNGLIRLDDKPDSAHPSVVISLLIPACVLFIRALTDVNVFDYENFWKPALLVLFIIGLLILKDTKAVYSLKKANTYFTIMGTLAFGGMYVYGLLITTNAAFDNSQPLVYKAGILGKYVSSGKTKTCYLKLSEWGPQTEIDDVKVPRDLYKSKEIGDTVTVHLQNGLFKIPYYFVVQ